MGLLRLRSIALGIAVLATTSCVTSKAVKQEKKELVRDLSPEEFTEQVEAYQREVEADLEALAETALARLEKDWQASLEDDEPFVHDILILSGGGAKGAFGAGFLQGWGTVTEGPTARPEFDVVTGVSTGALIAPFAFVGTDKAYARVADFYSDPQENWIKKRGELVFLPTHISLFQNLALQEYIRQQIDASVIEGIAREARDSRLLLIGATNADIGIGRVFNLGREAQIADASGEPDRVHSILLASSAIPGLFPPIEIDNFFYVDGGVASQIVSVLPLEFAHGPLQDWRENHKDRPLPRIRLWIVVNEKLRLSPDLMHARWNQIFKRSLEIMLRSSMLASLRTIQQQAENMAEGLGIEVELRYVSIPNDSPNPPHGSMFDRDFMIQLEELGRGLGADPSSWRTTVPEIHWLDEF